MHMGGDRLVVMQGITIIESCMSNATMRKEIRVHAEREE